MYRSLLALALAGALTTAWGQVPYGEPDWKEVEAPPPPALRTQGLIEIEVAGSSLRFGVDPDSISVGADSIVRYVVVASSGTGTVNGIYEGIRCNSGEVKVYARHNPDSGWVPTRNSEWQALRTAPNSRYSLAIARSGVCDSRSPNGSVAKIIRDLRAPADRRYETY